MTQAIKLTAPFTKEQAATLRAGDRVLLSGTIYSARDAAHKKLTALLMEGNELPIELKDNVIYYVGPTPAQEGTPIGSAGPTTSGRMDRYTPKLLDLGLVGMIGKGERGAAVCQSIVKNGAVYFAALGGAGALIAQCITDCKLIAYPELQSEAIYQLQITDLPLFVAIDSTGVSLYNQGRADYISSREKEAVPAAL